MTRKLAAAIALVAFVVLAVAWVGRANEGSRALADCEGALARGDLTEAIFAARIAAEARCPGCAAPELGLQKLEQIAREAEARGDHAAAFAAWRGVRTALLATSTLGTTSAARARAEAEVARLGHRMDAAAAAAGAQPTPAASEERLRTTLAESDLPSGATFALVGLGGAVFLLAAARFAAAGGSAGRFDLGLAAAGAALAALGALLF